MLTLGLKPFKIIFKNKSKQKMTKKISKIETLPRGIELLTIFATLPVAPMIFLAVFLAFVQLQSNFSPEVPVAKK